jgi:hypothetical protein
MMGFMENARDPDEDPTIDPILKLIGTMGGSAIGGPNTQSGEANAAEIGGVPARTNEMIALQCLTEASRLTDEIIERLRRRLAGEELGDNIHERNDSAAADVVADMAKRAAQAGDSQTYDTYFDIHEKASALPLIGGFIQDRNIASLCLEGIDKLGSQRAADALHSALEHEARKADYIEAMPNTAGSAYEPSITKLLAEVVTYCQLNGIPPDQWISTYARSDEHAHKLRIHAIKEAIEDGRGDRTVLQSQLDALRGEAPASDSEESAIRNAFRELHNAPQPAARTALFERFLRTIGNLSPPTQRSLAGDTTLNELVDVGLIALHDPQPQSQEVVRKLNEAIEKRIKDVLSIGGYLLHVGTPYVRWKIALEGGPEASAQTVLDIMNSTTQRLLEMQPVNPYDEITGEKETDNPRRVLFIKYSLTNARAREALAQNNFKLAGEFARAMQERGGILAEAIAQATTKEQIDELNLGSDPLEVMMDPSLEALGQFAEAKFADSPQILADTVLAYAQRTASYKFMQEPIMEAYRHVTSRDAATGQSFARSLLATLRARPKEQQVREYGMRKELSQALIRAGDPEEVQRARQEIDAMESPTGRRQALHNLAQLLNETP